MCARRFLGCIFWLTLIVVAGGLAFYFFGQQVLIRQATPQGHFRAPANGRPDYSAASSWLARPDLPDNPSDWAPIDRRLPDPVARTAATVFYLHPTTYLQRDRWNASLLPGGDTEFRTRLFAQSQASAFGQLGDVWAPRYRQAAYGAFLLKSDDAHKALDLAYGDVLAAFDEFLRRNPDGPIILAGHSQGALHLSRLLRDRAQQLRGRLVSAYVVGWPLSVTADLPSMGLAPCTAPDQVGCVLSWQSFADPANPKLIMDAWQGTKGPTGVKRERKDMLCVNPITGTKDGSAPPQANPGTLVPTADLRSASLVPGKVGAHCDDGLLLLDGEIPPLGPFVLPGNNYHVYDYALFWGAIRDDAERRLGAWQQR
jgi:hypothetical protein